MLLAQPLLQLQLLRPLHLALLLALLHLKPPCAVSGPHGCWHRQLAEKLQESRQQQPQHPAGVVALQAMLLPGQQQLQQHLANAASAAGCHAVVSDEVVPAAATAVVTTASDAVASAAVAAAVASAALAAGPRLAQGCMNEQHRLLQELVYPLVPAYLYLLACAAAAAAACLYLASYRQQQPLPLSLHQWLLCCLAAGAAAAALLHLRTHRSHLL